MPLIAVSTTLLLTVLEVVLILIVLIALAWVLLRVLQRPLTPTSGPIQILSRQPLEPRRALFLIQVGPHVFLIASSEQGISNLATLDHDTLPPIAPPQPLSLFPWRRTLPEPSAHGTSTDA